jgi:hypothetical protein
VWVTSTAYDVSDTGQFPIFIVSRRGLNQAEIPRSEHQELIITGHKAGTVPAEVSTAPFELAAGEIKAMHLADDQIDTAFINYRTAPFGPVSVTPQLPYSAGRNLQQSSAANVMAG